MNTFMTQHPILTISVIGSFLGTVLAYIAPGFTNRYMCAGRGFRIGNLGLNVFIHSGWGHLIGNLLILAFLPKTFSIVLIFSSNNNLDIIKT